jgi:hypothetical protein
MSEQIVVRPAAMLEDECGVPEIVAALDRAGVEQFPGARPPRSVAGADRLPVNAAPPGLRSAWSASKIAFISGLLATVTPSTWRLPARKSGDSCSSLPVRTSRSGGGNVAPAGTGSSTDSCARFPRDLEEPTILTALRAGDVKNYAFAAGRPAHGS